MDYKLEYENMRKLWLDSQLKLKTLEAEVQPPKTVVSYSIEDALLDNIRNHSSFKRCAKKLQDGTLKYVSIDYSVDAKELVACWEKEKSGIASRDIETHEPYREESKKVEEDLSNKHRVETRDGYTYQEQEKHQAKKEEASIYDV